MKHSSSAHGLPLPPTAVAHAAFAGLSAGYFLS
jgi:hypothetical protein